MRLNRESFLRTLDSVSAGLAQREILEQSSCFVFQNGQVYTFNDEVLCHAASSLDESLQAVVPSKPLLEQLRKWKEDDIEVTSTDNELHIKGKGRKFGIRREASVLLSFNEVEEPTEWKPLHPQFTEAINVVKNCASSDESDQLTVFVHIHPDWVEASDRSQVCRWKLDTGMSQPQLVRESSIKAITKLGVYEFGETRSWLFFRNPNGLVIGIRRYLDNYADIGNWLVAEGIDVALPKGLVEAADKAEIFSKENSSGNLVLVSLKPGKVRIKGIGITGWYSEPLNVEYTGEPFEFYISPAMLVDLVTRHGSCKLSNTRVSVETPEYRWVACLRVPERNVVETVSVE